MSSARRPTVKNSTIPVDRRPSLADALRLAPWITALGPAAVERLAPHARLRALAQGERVVRQGVPVRHLVLVVQGWLEVGVSSRSGRRLVLDQVVRGSTCGLAALLDNLPSLQDAQAGVDSLVLLLPRAVVLEALRDLPGFAEALLHIVAGRLRSLLSAYANRTLVTLQPRLATLLLRLARGLGPQQALQWSQDDLAAMLGVTRQAVNPALKQMERDGLIALGYRRLEVLDAAGLRLLRKR